MLIRVQNGLNYEVETALSAKSREIVVLLLKDVLYRHPEIRSLEEFLVRKYSFKNIEEKEHKISELKKIIPTKHKVVFKEEVKSSIVSERSERRFSSLKIYEGDYMDARISVCILGEVIQSEDVIVGTREEEQYLVNSSRYQMIRFMSDSGFAMQQLVESLTVDLGLRIRQKEWSFHRSKES